MEGRTGSRVMDFGAFCAGFSIGFGLYIPINNIRIYLFDNPANIILSKLLYLKYAKGLFLISRSFRKSVCAPDLLDNLSPLNHWT